MKTRKAYWLKDFDAERILSRPYFKRFNLPKIKDDEILTSLKDSADDADTIDELEEKVQLIRALHDQAKKFTDKMMERYLSILATARGVNAIPVPMDVMDAETGISRLLKKLEKIYYEVEGMTQQKYRKEFADRLKKYRKAAGLTQRELGELVQISQRGISNYDTAARDISTWTLIRICKALNVSADELLGLK